MRSYDLKSIFRDKGGYSLIEISIVLIIMGTLASFSLPLLTHFMSASKLKVTQSNQEYILRSLAAYVIQYHYLPCPADPTLTGSERGEARKKCQTDAECVGIIPYRTLGIPEEIAKDGYHHFMTYAVNPDLSGTLMTTKLSFDKYCNCKTGNLKVSYSDKTPVQASPEKEKANQLPLALVLLSEGEAYKKPLTELEAKNNTRDLHFYDSSGGSRKHLRHVIRWITSWDLLSSYANISCAPFKKDEKKDKM